MKKFEFRLANVARIRALEESVAKEQFMIALRDLKNAVHNLHQAEEGLNTIVPLSGTTTGAQIEWARDQIERQVQLIEDCRVRVASLRTITDQKRGIWSEASKKSHVLEKLNEQSHKEWREDQQRQEIAELDDLTTIRYFGRSLI